MIRYANVTGASYLIQARAMNILLNWPIAWIKRPAGINYPAVFRNAFRHGEKESSHSQDWLLRLPDGSVQVLPILSHSGNPLVAYNVWTMFATILIVAP